MVELGAGYCHFINNIQAGRRIAPDVSPTVIAAAAPGVEAHTASCMSCDFVPDESADVVFASSLLEHLTTSEVLRTVQQAHRILRPGGKFILVKSNFRYCYREYFDDYTHVSIFTDVSLCDVLTSVGFKIRDVQPRFLPFSIKRRLPIAGWLIALYLRSPVRPKAGQMLVIAAKGT